MDSVYLASLILGGFFVLLSIFGGDAEADLDADIDVDIDADIDIDSDIGAGAGFVDLFSLRTFFLFAAFFGLTGTALTWIGSDPTLTAVLAIVMGLSVGFGGNYFIKRVGYAHISSDVTMTDLKGLTGKVLIPFSGDERGKISVVVKGSQVRMLARSFEDSSLEPFEPGDEVVVVRTENGVVEVIKPT